MIPRHFINLESQEIEAYIGSGRRQHLYEILVRIGELATTAEKAMLQDAIEEKLATRPEDPPGQSRTYEGVRT